METEHSFILPEHRGELPVRIRSLRIQAGYTQEYVSRKLHVTRQAYNNYERGIRTPSLQSLKDLCALYEISVEYLLI